MATGGLKFAEDSIGWFSVEQKYARDNSLLRKFGFRVRKRVGNNSVFWIMARSWQQS